ncbi:hypothetical protein QNH39_18695 [Neobacillus novalis]|uniref:DUF3899 domain-containing protein n=1 Tax=Neobacillus novalis TaxID=220687 RepID=A0AA95MIY2_9BACI|nr:hypothetical protein [Neobacillus novalis]WHY84667.1 hypothetical protein QNH39_18695 [Neobacillus novalis]
MKRLIGIIFTLLVLFGINFIIAKNTNKEFIEYSFAVGFVLTTLIWFLTSKGGFTSHYIDTTIQGQTNIKMKRQKFKFTPNIIFLTALSYTIVSLIITLIYYWEYL